MRFNTPQEVLEWAEKVAKADIQRHLEHGIDLNPFCTPGAREDWRRGFQNLGPRSYEGPRDFDTMYQRGAAVSRLLEQALVDKAGELGFEIVKDTESDYYMFKAKNWVEDSEPIFDTPKEAAQAVIDIYGERK